MEEKKGKSRHERSPRAEKLGRSCRDCGLLAPLGAKESMTQVTERYSDS